MSILAGPTGVGYLVHWRDQHGRHRHRRRTKQAALVLQRRIQRELESCQSGIPTWNDTIRDYYAMIRGAGLRKTSVNEITRVIVRFTKHAKPFSLSNFTAKAVSEYLAWRRNDKREPRQGTACQPSPYTVRKDWGQLKAFGAWCVRNGHLDRNPVSQVPRPIVPKRTPRAPEDAEWLSLLRAVPRTMLDDPQGWHLLILLAVTTGVRQGALLNVGPADVQFCGSEHDGVGLLRVVSKGNVESYHGLPAVVADRVARRIGDLPDGSTRLFRWRDRHAGMRRPWERLCRSAGFTHSFHSLRRASATRRAEALATAAAQQHLGHSDQSVTRGHYLEVVRVQRAIAASAILPDLPPMPAFRLYEIGPTAIPRPIETAAPFL